jgi:hypothetical protein
MIQPGGEPVAGYGIDRTDEFDRGRRRRLQPQSQQIAGTVCDQLHIHAGIREVGAGGTHNRRRRHRRRRSARRESGRRAIRGA